MKKSILVATVLSLAFVSCTKDEESNNAPNAFEVTVTSQAVSGGSIIIIDKEKSKFASVSPSTTEYEYVVTWTDAVDPDGDVVTYDVVIGNNTIATGTSVKTATISEDDLGDGSDQTVIVTAKDGKGSETVINKAFTKTLSKSLY